MITEEVHCIISIKQNDVGDGHHGDMCHTKDRKTKTCLFDPGKADTQPVHNEDVEIPGNEALDKNYRVGKGPDAPVVKLSFMKQQVVEHHANQRHDGKERHPFKSCWFHCL